MYYKILKRSEYNLADAFTRNHPNGSFFQDSSWQKVKSNWQGEIVAVFDDSDTVCAVSQLLIQKGFIYCPRGPVCNYADFEAFDVLKQGIDEVAKIYKAHKVKFDPDILFSDTIYLNEMKKRNFKHIYGKTSFETIQARFNYRLNIDNKTADEVLMNFTQQCRRNIRLAIRHGVTVSEENLSGLDEFYEIYKITGKRDSFTIRPKEYLFRFLQNVSGAKLILAKFNGKVLAGALSVCYGKTYSYVYGASGNENRNLMPNYLVQWYMIQDAIKSNCKTYDFQGISSLHPGLLRFKSGFNGRTDELLGELDYNYKPVKAFLMDTALKLRKVL